MHKYLRRNDLFLELLWKEPSNKEEFVNGSQKNKLVASQLYLTNEKWIATFFLAQPEAFY